ncbi:hypothetical protein AHAS_Ahas14G0179800 [Arachis hypogaea]
MSVAEYTNKFEEFCRFSRVCQGDPETFESWRCIKYQRGLKDSIMTTVTPMEIRVFSDLVNKARVVEEYAKTVAASKDTHGGGSSKGRGKYYHPRGQSFKRGGYVIMRIIVWFGIDQNRHQFIGSIVQTNNEFSRSNNKFK